jgi:hypothetical protein
MAGFLANVPFKRITCSTDSSTIAVCSSHNRHSYTIHLWGVTFHATFPIQPWSISTIRHAKTDFIQCTQSLIQRCAPNTKSIQCRCGRTLSLFLSQVSRLTDRCTHGSHSMGTPCRATAHAVEVLRYFGQTSPRQTCAVDHVASLCVCFRQRQTATEQLYNVLWDTAEWFRCYRVIASILLQEPDRMRAVEYFAIQTRSKNENETQNSLTIRAIIVLMTGQNNLQRSILETHPSRSTS